MLGIWCSTFLGAEFRRSSPSVNGQYACILVSPFFECSHLAHNLTPGATDSSNHTPSMLYIAEKSVAISPILMHLSYCCSWFLLPALSFTISNYEFSWIKLNLYVCELKWMDCGTFCRTEWKASCGECDQRTHEHPDSTAGAEPDQLTTEHC